MADRTIGELDPVKEVPIGDLPQVLEIYDDSLIPVEQQGMAMRMTGKQFRQFGEKTAEIYVQTAVDAAESAKETLGQVEQAGADALENVREAETGALTNIEDKRQDAVEEMTELRDTTEGYKDEAAESAQKAVEYSGKPPLPNPETGNWDTWNADSQEYADTGETYRGSLLYATFFVDPKTGMLYQVTDSDYTGPQFQLNGPDLEVVLNAND